MNATRQYEEGNVPQTIIRHSKEDEQTLEEIRIVADFNYRQTAKETVSRISARFRPTKPLPPKDQYGRYL